MAFLNTFSDTLATRGEKLELLIDKTEDLNSHVRNRNFNIDIYADTSITTY